MMTPGAHTAYIQGRRRARRAAGLCRDCIFPAPPGRSMCPVHAEHHREQVKRRRLTLKRLGRLEKGR